MQEGVSLGLCTDNVLKVGSKGRSKKSILN